jgi:CRP/FNR family cyclic AMP-dependent transcriptional regulator
MNHHSWRYAPPSKVSVALPPASDIEFTGWGSEGGLCKFLDPLNEFEKRVVTSRGTDLALKRGELLFRQGSSHSGIYIIRKGRIRTFYVSPSGREITLAYWSSRHFVGGPEVFGRGTHVWSGMAMCNAEVLYLTGTQLRELILELPNFALALIEGQITKGQCFSSLIQLLGTKSASARLAYILLSFQASEEDPADGGISGVENFTHVQLASIIGVTRQWVSATLQSFRDDGLLRLEGRKIIVVDRERLRMRSL